MKSSIVVLAQAALARHVETDDYQFTLYMAQFNKNYQSLEEYSLRLIEYSKVNHQIMKFSSQPHTSWVTHNRFSDWTSAERDFLMGYHINKREFRRQAFYPPDAAIKPVNWVEHGAVSPVQNQHICGSDWAFSAAGIVESANFFETGLLHDISE